MDMIQYLMIASVIGKFKQIILSKIMMQGINSLIMRYTSIIKRLTHKSMEIDLFRKKARLETLN